MGALQWCHHPSHQSSWDGIRWDRVSWSYNKGLCCRFLCWQCLCKKLIDTSYILAFKHLCWWDQNCWWGSKYFRVSKTTDNDSYQISRTKILLCIGSLSVRPFMIVWSFWSKKHGSFDEWPSRSSFWWECNHGGVCLIIEVSEASFRLSSSRLVSCTVFFCFVVLIFCIIYSQENVKSNQKMDQPSANSGSGKSWRRQSQSVSD